MQKIERGYSDMKEMNQLYWIKKEIKQIQQELEELSELNSSQMTGMPHSKKTISPVERLAEQKIRLQHNLEIILDRYITERERIEKIISNVEDAEIRVLARKRFIDNEDYTQISKEEHMDRTTVYKKLKKYFG